MKGRIGRAAPALAVGVAALWPGVAHGAGDRLAERDTSYMERTCERTGDLPPMGELEKTTEPAPGSLVAPGDLIRVTLRWDPRSWRGDELHKVIDCVTIDGVLDLDLSVEQRPAGNGGLFETGYRVPAGLPAGVEVCDFGFASGDQPGGGFEQRRSELVCFEVAPEEESVTERRPQEATPPTPVESPAPTPVAPPVPGPQVAGVVEGAPPRPAPAAEVLPAPLVVSALPRTGPGGALPTVAGLALALGGLAVVGAHRRPSVRRL